ncbi:hypothetical protein BN7_4795 [Wickerhamomyces ciferrii]|uniref:Uncharacterized protein n=1 Tax=Wickerhamomyces ciferrii (strain ATCC 14091 / BCRC 22168 / CBS 111 / JCM 3599 / NBRC 0793 / NRRL Y-1031 F-60-10) TaxID=1206466 RepID=K0KUV6_WICCF|nr:uncharacterized protein BN7_4795 [Wickerhamomyces ciferrii]CCH45214.1 hypothetical protein BN7_4795 [Wickerhamomyces ciferrii]
MARGRNNNNNNNNINFDRAEIFRDLKVELEQQFQNIISSPAVIPFKIQDRNLPTLDVKNHANNLSNFFQEDHHMLLSNSLKYAFTNDNININADNSQIIPAPIPHYILPPGINDEDKFELFNNAYEIIHQKFTELLVDKFNLRSLVLSIREAGHTNENININTNPATPQQLLRFITQYEAPNMVHDHINTANNLTTLPPTLPPTFEKVLQHVNTEMKKVKSRYQGEELHEAIESAFTLFIIITHSRLYSNTDKVLTKFLRSTFEEHGRLKINEFLRTVQREQTSPSNLLTNLQNIKLINSMLPSNYSGRVISSAQKSTYTRDIKHTLEHQQIISLVLRMWITTFCQ